MKAVVKAHSGPGISVADVPEPRVQPGEALVRVSACGICGSDVATYLWKPHKRHLARHLPMVLGHEGVGRVEAVGSGVVGLRVGDRVVTEPIVACGHCAMCRNGRPNICTNSRVLGSTVPGVMAPLASIPEQALVRIPEEIPEEQAALLEVLGTAMHAVERAGAVIGARCAIVGPGAIGLLLLRILRVGGAGPVTVFGTTRSPQKLRLAEELGASDALVLPGEGEDLPHEARYDLVFEAAGHAGALAAAARFVAPAGRIVVVGSYDEPLDLRMYTNVRSKEADIITTRARSASTWERVVRLVQSGILDLGFMKTVEVPIEDAAQAFEMAAAGIAPKVTIRCG